MTDFDKQEVEDSTLEGLSILAKIIAEEIYKEHLQKKGGQHSIPNNEKKDAA